MPRAASLLSASFAVVAAAVAAFAVAGTGHATRDAVLSSHGMKPTLYVGQAATGAGDGRSCANAKAVSFFNTASNWGAGKPIAPGTKVGLCGTVKSTLTFRGNGTSGHPITLRFQPGAKISQPACGPCLVMSGRSFITVDGGSNGILEGTNNGTTLGLQTTSTGIMAQPCNNCEVKNLTIQNIYVHSGTSNEIDQTQVRAIVFNGSNFSFHDNVVHDAGWAINFGDNGESNDRVYDNDIYRVDHGVVPSFGTSGGSTGPYYIYGNHFHDFGNWDTSNNAYHHDGIHCYSVAGGKAQHISDFYIYDNRFDGDIGRNATAWVFIEGGTGPGRTPCADATSNIWVFNNVATLNHDSNNGAFGLFSGRTLAYDNTFVGHGTSGGNLCEVTTVAGAAFVNNICTTANDIAGFSVPSGGWAAGSPDYNVYANGGSNAFVCKDSGGLHFYNFSQFAPWKSCVAGDSHSTAVSSAQLNADGSPQGTSPVLAAGTNLQRLCTGNLRRLCFDIRGALRPFRMRPDAGAFQRETAAITARAIGRVRLGSSRGAIERFYGRRSTHRSGRQLLGFLRLRGTRTAAYRRHGGLFDVSYAGGKVAAVATTSRYYTTLQGFGAGAAAKLPGGGWRPCGKAFVRRRGGVATVVGVGGGNIVAVAIARSAIVVCR